MEANRTARRTTSSWADRRTGGVRERTSVRDTVVVPTLKRGPDTALCRSTRAKRRFSVVLGRAHPSGWEPLWRLLTPLFLPIIAPIITEPHGRLISDHEPGTARHKPHRFLGHSQPDQRLDYLREQPVLHLEYPSGEPVRCVIPTDRRGPLRADRATVILLV